MPERKKSAAKPAKKAGSFDRLGISVDCAVFGFDEGELKVALVRREIDPYKGKWGLPGGFVQESESLEEAAKRTLHEETGISRVFLEQLGAFGETKRDPRGRIISVAYYSLVKLADQKIRDAAEEAQVAWHGAHNPPQLAFDHKRVLASAIDKLRNNLRQQPIGFELLPRKFKLSQLQHLYEAVLGRELDKRNFRRKVLSLGILEELNEFETGVAHRAARLYRFDQKGYDALIRKGFHFEI